VSDATPSATEPTRMRQLLPRILLSALAIWGFPSGKQTTGPPEVGGAGFALAPRKLKRPVQRLRINASPNGSAVARIPGLGW
jgi:hypothetical protein